MNEPTNPSVTQPPTVQTHDMAESTDWTLPLSRRQRVLFIGLLVLVAIVIWRRRLPSDDIEREQSGIDKSPEPESEGAIRIPIDPDDELEKDAAVVEALRTRGKMGSE